MGHTTIFIRTLSFGSIISVLFLTAGCQTAGSTKEVTLTTPLPEVSQRAYATGYRVSGTFNGRQSTSILVSQTDTTETWKFGNGCVTTSLKTGFSPGLKWSNCSGADGTQEVKLVSGTPYPLKIGNAWSYSLSGQNDNNNSWDGMRDCEVTSAVRIKTVSGEHNTLKVVCIEPWSTRTWYISPALKRSVRYVRNHSRRGVTEWEFVKVVKDSS